MEKKDELITKLEAEIETLQKQLLSEQSKYCELLSDYSKLYVNNGTYYGKLISDYSKLLSKYNSDQERITSLKKFKDVAEKYIESLEKEDDAARKYIKALEKENTELKKQLADKINEQHIDGRRGE